MKITVLQWLQEEKLLLNEKLAEKEENPAVKRKAELKEENPVVKRKAELKEENPVVKRKAELKEENPAVRNVEVAELNAREDDKFVKNLQSSTRLAICIPFSKLIFKN